MRVFAYSTTLLVIAAVTPAAAQEFGGHVKTQLLATSYPSDSLFRQLIGPTSSDQNLDARLKLTANRDAWDLTADYQFIVLHGDNVELGRDLSPEFRFFTGRLPEDDRRLFDLTHVIRDDGKLAALHRLDRLAVGYTSDKAVVRFGRQAVSWGNGLIYSPMDIFNPFDPATVDKEYKTGDDMLYGQYLRDSGDDIQTVLVFRRDPFSGDVESDQSSLGFKYHGFMGSSEYDLLAASHFDDALLGVGGNRSIGGAIWRGDIVLTSTDDDTVASVVTSLSHSWTWAEKNVSGTLEYFFNGFGQRDGRYDPASLAANPELIERIARGEVFTLGRHYLAASALIEMTPLFLLTPNVFVNLSDGSALLQLVTQNDLRENLLLLGAVNLPLGSSGTEFGGIDTGVPGVQLSSGAGIFLQLAWYF